MKDIRILGVDLGKNSCSIVGLDGAGRVLLRRRARREGVIALAAKLPGCVVAMEACCGAHHLGRLLVEQGHEVRLMSPEYVRLFNDGVATRRGVAVSAIRDGHCQACQVTVRPQQIMQARKGDEIVLCESCKRILYVPPPAAPVHWPLL